jgi:hypothetical protein
MKPAEIVLRSGGGRMRETDEGGKSKIYCKHIYKCHNISFLYNYYMLIKNK